MTQITRCSVATCERQAHCKGFCENHYRKFHRYGDPLAGSSYVRLSGTPEQRFWPRVDKNGPVPEHRPDLGPCWLWTTTASTANGYPQFRCGKRMVLAYRFAYENVVGPIPEGFQLDHMCHNQHPTCSGGSDCPHRKCVNPAHLDPVTNDENSARRAGMNYGRLCRNKLHVMTDDNVRYTPSGIKLCRTCNPGRRADLDLICANGHPRTPENVYTTKLGVLACRICTRDAMRRSRNRSASSTQFKD